MENSRLVSWRSRTVSPLTRIDCFVLQHVVIKNPLSIAVLGTGSIKYRLDEPYFGWREVCPYTILNLTVSICKVRDQLFTFLPTFKTIYNSLGHVFHCQKNLLFFWFGTSHYQLYMLRRFNTIANPFIENFKYKPE